MRGKVISCALLVAVAGRASVSLAQSGPPEPSPDTPKFFVWSQGIPCGVVPTRSDFLSHMVKYWVAPDREADDSATDVVNYIKRHTQNGSVPAAW